MNGPFHFTQHPFTSTLNHKSPFNLWLVILTALFFFLVLSFYNFGLSLYDYWLNRQNMAEKQLKENLTSSLWFLLIWLFLVILVYIFLNYNGFLDISPEEEKYWEQHPLLRSEARDIAQDVMF